jgi:hypothetical protein
VLPSSDFFSFKVTTISSECPKKKDTNHCTLFSIPKPDYFLAGTAASSFLLQHPFASAQPEAFALEQHPETSDFPAHPASAFLSAQDESFLISDFFESAFLSSGALVLATRVTPAFSDATAEALAAVTDSPYTATMARMNNNFFMVKIFNVYFFHIHEANIILFIMKRC